MKDNKNNITISVETIYLQQDSEPENNKYFFLYTILIRNMGSVGAKLLSRHWIIKDSNGKKQDVKGDGVVGSKQTPGVISKLFNSILTFLNRLYILYLTSI